LKRIIIILAFLLLPIPRVGHIGAYNTLSELIWCKTPKACLHETGHKLDDNAGWISSSKDFQDTIDDMNLNLWDNYKEAYASLFVIAEGKKENTALRLQKFYDWDRANEITE